MMPIYTVRSISLLAGSHIMSGRERPSTKLQLTAPVYSLPRAVSAEEAPGCSRSLEGLLLGRPYGQRSQNHAYRSTHGSASSARSVALANL